jgi:hypothetical protein
MFKFKLFLCSLFLGAAAHAQVTVPNTFQPASPAKASEVNANFTALATAINALTARVAKLEGTIVAADLVGTYAMSGLGVETNNNHIAHYAFQGSIVLNANGSASYTVTQTGHQTNIGGTPFTDFAFPGGGTSSGTTTWTFANGVVTITGLNSFNVSGGGKVLVAANTGTGNPVNNVLAVLSRL